MLVLEEWEHAEAPWRHDPRRGARRRQQRRRPPHHRPVARRRRRGRRAWSSRSTTPASTPATSPTINAHGTSTPLNDAAEAEADAPRCSATPGPPVTSIKGVTGHALGAAGAIEAVAVVLSMRHRLIPPTADTTTVDLDIDLVTGEGRPWEPGPTLSNSFGFGGHNGSVILAPAP